MSAFAQDRVERDGVHEVVLNGAGNPFDLEPGAAFPHGAERHTPEEIVPLARYRVADRGRRATALRGKPYMALRIQRVGAVAAGPGTPAPGALVEDGL